MVVGTVEQSILADVVFVIEGTASNGAYMSEFKTNYLIPTLEYFSQGSIEERDYVTESTSALYALVVFHASDCLPNPSTECFGPFSSPQKLISILDSLEMAGGRGESHCNVAEGLATALQCLEDLQLKREPGASTQKHCILVCNSPPYQLPVLESLNFSGNTAEQLAGILQETSANLSVLSPRKIPSLFKLFEKAGGDLPASQTKNYAKDPRHLVLLNGFSLKERPISPVPGPGHQNPQIQPMPSPNIGSPVPAPPAPPAVFRPTTPTMSQAAPGRTAQHMPYPTPQAAAPPYPAQQPGVRPQGIEMRGPSPRWPIPGQGGPPQMMQPQHRFQQQNQGSALIAQLTQPPSAVNVLPPSALNNQFAPIRMDGGQGGMNALQQQQQAQMLAQQRMAQVLGPNAPAPQQIPPQGTPQSGAQQGVPQQQAGPPIQQGNPQAAAGTSGAPPPPMGRERQTIWTGMLEWIEKAKNANDAQKMTRHVPCQVSANTRDGEPELRADGWPQKLLMQLMPKQLIGNIGGAYLKNSKSVLFHPQTCEALDALTKVMSSGFAGCVHFTSLPNPNICDIKVLILLYTAEKRAYLGFIPNDQTAFVDRLRKVIQHQKSTQAMRQQGPSTAGPPPQGQPGLMMSQTNAMAMGGVQITQNNVPGGLGPQQGGPQRPQMNMQVGFETNDSLMSGSGPGGLRTNQGQQQQGGPPPQNQPPRMPGGQQPAGAPQQAGSGSAPGPQNTQGGGSSQGQGQGGMLEEARQQNLRKIQQLRHTLEQAQQQEQQYKNQLEIISHMKIQQLQQTLEHAQQQEVQYKNQLEEEQQKLQLRAQLQQLQQRQMTPQGQPPPMQAQGMTPQQQRMMRPAGAMPPNPGLRHLLQQQPQYRQQQVMGGMGGMGGGPRQIASQQQQQQNQQQSQGQFNEDCSTFDFLG